MPYENEEGQTVILAALAMSIFLIGALGLAVDGAYLYAHRQMAQTAADAAAQAGILSIFDDTNTAGSAGFSTASAFTCGTGDARTPCFYARLNGFGSSTNDTVTVDFPPTSAAPGVNFSPTDPTPLIRVTVQRSIPTILMGLLGITTSAVRATAMAAIVNVNAPTPIIITHPSKSGSLATNGGVTIAICGGPNRSIQVNSSSGSAIRTSGSGMIDLSKAGPNDPGDCSTGTGADFGVWGGPSSPPFRFLSGSTGKYRQPASPVEDPLAGVAPPPIPTNTGPMGKYTELDDNTSGCPPSPKKGCRLYSPGRYTNGIDGRNSTPVFKPGIYYIQSNQGISCDANCSMYMATGFTDSGPNTTNTGWTGNLLIYNTGPASNPTNAGAIDIGANGSISLVGSPSNSIYQGILFFQDRNSRAQVHSLGGGGGLSLLGTVYLNNTLAIMQGDPSHFQTLDLQGHPGSDTLIEGEIIVGVLQLGGNASITMNLNPNSPHMIRQVAMVN